MAEGATHAVRRRTSNRDLMRLRGLAKEGYALATAARTIGIAENVARYWAVKERIVFSRHGRRRIEVSPEAAAYRVRQMMQRLMGK